MGRIRQWSVLLGAAMATAAALGTPALAEPQEVELAADEDWRHAWTAMTFPARIGSYERQSITQFEDRDTNQGARYADAVTNTILSLYIYRPGHPDPSIWHDRAITALLSNTQMGPFDPDTVSISAFVPPGGSLPSGIRSVLEGGGDYRSTGTALYRAGEWLIKVRLSSTRLEAAALDGELAGILDGLPPLEGVSETPAYRVPQCPGEPSFSNAERMDQDDDSRMLAAVSEGLLGDGMIAELMSEVRGEDATARSGSAYCSIGEKTARAGIYLPSDSSDSYLIALGDAGLGISVAPARVLDAVRKAEGESVGFYRVATADGLEVQTFLPFAAMPSPNQAVQAVLNEAPIIATTRPLPGDEGGVSTIYTDESGESAQSIE